MLNFSFAKTIGWVGERKASALLLLGMYVALFALMALAFFSQDQPQWGRCFAAMAICYGAGFFALAAGWFWGRWFAIGLGYSGLTTAIWAMISVRYLAPPLVFFGVTHGLVALLLQGEKMAEAFDWQTAWRERFHVEDEAVIRIRKTVVRAVSGLPTMIMFLLAPREQGMAIAGVLLVLGLVASLAGLLRLRTWAWLSWGVLICATVAFIANDGLFLNQLKWSSGIAGPFLLPFHSDDTMSMLHHWTSLGGIAALWMATALVPFARLVLRSSKP